MNIKSFKSALLASATLAAMQAMPAFAQDAPPAENTATDDQAPGVTTQEAATQEAVAEGEDIVVTGTLIRNHNLKSIIEKLPSHVNGSIEPPLALRQFAFHIAEALRQQGSASLLLSRQDDAVRGEYRRLLRAPLVREVDSYLRHRQPGTQVADYDRARLAELIITVIESIVVNFDSDIALNLDCNEMLNRSIEAMCAAFGIQGTQSSC